MNLSENEFQGSVSSVNPQPENSNFNPTRDSFDLLYSGLCLAVVGITIAVLTVALILYALSPNCTSDGCIYTIFYSPIAIIGGILSLLGLVQIIKSRHSKVFLKDSYGFLLSKIEKSKKLVLISLGIIFFMFFLLLFSSIIMINTQDSSGPDTYIFFLVSLVLLTLYGCLVLIFNPKSKRGAFVKAVLSFVGAGIILLCTFFLFFAPGILFLIFLTSYLTEEAKLLHLRNQGAISN